MAANVPFHSQFYFKISCSSFQQIQNLLGMSNWKEGMSQQSHKRLRFGKFWRFTWNVIKWKQQMMLWQQRNWQLDFDFIIELRHFGMICYSCPYFLCKVFTRFGVNDRKTRWIGSIIVEKLDLDGNVASVASSFGSEVDKFRIDEEIVDKFGTWSNRRIDRKFLKFFDNLK